MSPREALHRLSMILPPVFFLIAAVVVYKELAAYNIKDLSQVVTGFPPKLVALAVLLTFVNYLFLGFYDWTGLRYTGHKLPLRKVIPTSFISYAISNNTGHALISGSSIRFRFYTAWGVAGWDILKLSLFLVLTFMIGALTLEVGSLSLMPDKYLPGIDLPQTIKILTGVSAFILLLFWIAVFFYRKPLRIKDIDFRLPSPGLALMQTIIACIDITMAAYILYIFVGNSVDVPFASFLIIYVIAMLLGLFSQVPGGIGVFEGAFLWLAGPEFDSAPLVGALILYRIVYFFLPLAIAGIALATLESYEHRHKLARGGQILINVMARTVPQIYSVLFFFTGALMLISSAMPNLPGRVGWLKDAVPLTVVEISHMTGSIIGLLMLFLARAVRLRLDAAYFGCVVLLVLGIAASFLRGMDWPEVAVMALMLALFLPTRHYFDRKASVLDMPFPAGWVATILTVLVLGASVGFFAYRHIEYAHELWWRFSYREDAPRFLRAAAVVGLTALAYVLYRFFAVAAPKALALPGKDEIARAVAVAKSGSTPSGLLAALGDKYFIWSENGAAFLMYAVRPRFWIAMGDPVGNPAAFEDVVWRFREQADRHGAQAVFYQVSDKYLPLYVDLGLILLKMGEEAVVDLPGFELTGTKFGNQRHTLNKFRKNGFKVTFLSPQETQGNMQALRALSRKWLETKKAQEKKFSLGFFDESYLLHTRVAVVEKEGAILAFANLWELDSREKIAVDLMRYDPQAPAGVMEYLFIELLLWAKEQGYKRFNLGMAPLAGLEQHPLAPLWYKIGAIIYRHGEEFYNFEGLQAYKSKFGPAWRPRYLAAPPGLKIPVVLMDIATVIAGNIQGLFKK